MLRTIFIGGCERSGTTFLGHELAFRIDGSVVTPESQFKTDTGLSELKGKVLLEKLEENWRFQVWGVSGAEICSALEARNISLDTLTLDVAIDVAVRIYGRKHGRPDVRVWIDHTPDNLINAWRLRRRFTDPMFLCVVRDGRAVFASLKNVEWGPKSPGKAADFWKAKTCESIVCSLSLGKECRVIRYEDLVACDGYIDSLAKKLAVHSDIVLSATDRESFARSSVPEFTKTQHALVGEPPDASRARSFESSLSAYETSAFESSAAEILNALNYELITSRQRPDGRMGAGRLVQKVHVGWRVILSWAVRPFLYRWRRRTPMAHAALAKARHWMNRQRFS